MSKETQLNKEFRSSDINRIRNIIAGKYGEKTKTQVGFEKLKTEYKEGDIWEENNKTWTIKDGIKQTITKLDSIKNLIHFPLKCPCCDKAMKNHSLNKKMYLIHGKCSDCVIEMETKLKIEGKFEEYEKNLLNLNKDSHLNEFEMALDEYANSKNESFITEDGIEERWNGGGVDEEWIRDMKQYIKEQKQIKI